MKCVATAIGIKRVYLECREMPRKLIPAHAEVTPVSAVRDDSGDTFHGAFAFAIARHIAVEQAILFASAAAALKAAAAGGKRRGWEAIPTLDEVLEFLRARLDEPERSSLLVQLQVLREPANPAQ